jgi:hypothetical protein
MDSYGMSTGATDDAESLPDREDELDGELRFGRRRRRRRRGLADGAARDALSPDRPGSSD